MSLSGVVTRDIQLALSIAKNGAPAAHKFQTIKGNRDVFENLVRDYELHPEWDIAWDIETPRSIDMADDESEIDSIQAQVTQIQFAHHSDAGFVFPGFEAEYVREGTKRLLGLSNRKLSWNGWKFDNKVVSGHHGIPILGLDVDLMSAWHWVQPDLPQGLQFATSFHAPHLPPWKHLAIADEDTYGACDVISLILNRDGIFDVMDKRGLRTSYDRHCLSLRTEMVQASHRGFPVDPPRHDAFGEKVKAEISVINTSIQEIIPDEIRVIEPKRKDKKSGITEIGFVRTPKQILHLLSPDGTPLDGGDRVLLSETPDESDLGDGEEENDSDSTSEGPVVVTYIKRSVPRFNKETLEDERVERWCRLKPFSVGSPQQKIAYIKLRRGQEVQERMSKGQPRDKAERLAKHIVPQVRNKQKEMKDNTGAKELEKLFKSTGDPVYKHLVEIGKLKKLYGTYYKGWHVRDGYVHTTFGLADTGTGQLSSVDPNIQNAPKHSQLAKEFRGCIMAKPGRKLVEIDKKAFHAQTLAFEAKDKAYARLAAIDVHSYMTAHRLKLPEAKSLLSWSDVDMMAWIKTKKKESTIYKSEAVPNYPDGLTFQQVRDYKSKKVILGIGFCQGALSIFEQNPEGYKDKKEVQTFLDLFGSIFDGVKKFQTEITQLAHKQTYLISRWGYIRRFYDVFQWAPNKWNTFTGSAGDWAHGDDYEAAVAFLPANDAFGMLKEEMLRIAGHEPWPSQSFNKTGDDLFLKYNFINQIHDSLIFHPQEDLADRCIEDILGVMRQPCPVLYNPGMELEGLAGWTKDGLMVDAEAMVGVDWAHMSTVS